MRIHTQKNKEKLWLFLIFANVDKMSTFSANLEKCKQCWFISPWKLWNNNGVFELVSYFLGFDIRGPESGHWNLLSWHLKIKFAIFSHNKKWWKYVWIISTNVQSNLCSVRRPSGPKIMAVVERWLLFRGNLLL